MSATGAAGGSSTIDRATFPEIEDEIGYDPARFLDRPLVVSRPRIDSGSPMLLARAMIQGLQERRVLGYWLDVEVELDRGPREKVLGWINTRDAYLKKHGDYPDWELGPRRPPSWTFEPSTAVLRRDGEIVPWSTQEAATAKPNRE